MTQNLKMLHDQVLVEPEADEKSSGGIYLPDSAKEKPTEGKVRAVGTGTLSADGKLIPLTVKCGDKIIYRKWAGNEVKHDGVEYMVMKESDIIAIVEGK